MPPPTVIAALAAALARDPGRPLVTFYDLATGERIELSVKTFDNWVSKIANLFTDELMLDRGDTVSVHLPPHWQSTAIVVAAWTSGLTLSTTGQDATLTVVGPAALSSAHRPDGLVLACSMRPMGGRFLEPLPDGWLDFAVEVPPQPDALLAPVDLAPADIAVEGRAGQTTHSELVDEALEAASALGLRMGSRLITDANPGRASGLVPALVAPLMVDAALVLTAAAETRASDVARIAEQERTTSSLWLSG